MRKYQGPRYAYNAKKKRPKSKWMMKEPIGPPEPIYSKNTIVRMNMTELDVKTWKIGESDELKKWIGFGFYNTEFILKKNKTLIVVYNKMDIVDFEIALHKYLDEEFFDKICNRWFELIELSKTLGYERTAIQCMPILTIFDEISKHPEWANDSMIRRLKRVRENTHEFVYKLNLLKD